ncbi:hypothetical protein D3C87_2011780 [compost metagenome]
MGFDLGYQLLQTRDALGALTQGIVFFGVAHLQSELIDRNHLAHLSTVFDQGVGGIEAQRGSENRERRDQAKTR